MTVSDRDLRIIEECSDTDEPILVLRAKDRFARDTIVHYLNLVSYNREVDQDFIDSVGHRIHEFAQFAESHPDLMKTPDLRQGENSSSPIIE